MINKLESIKFLSALGFISGKKNTPSEGVPASGEDIKQFFWKKKYPKPTSTKKPKKKKHSKRNRRNGYMDLLGSAPTRKKTRGYHGYDVVNRISKDQDD